MQSEQEIINNSIYETQSGLTKIRDNLQNELQNKFIRHGLVDKSGYIVPLSKTYKNCDYFSLEIFPYCGFCHECWYISDIKNY